MKTKHIIDGNSRNVKEIVIPLQKRQEILTNKDKYHRMKHHKISRVLKNSTLSNFVRRKGI